MAPFRPVSATRAASASASTSRPSSPTEDDAESEYHVHAGMYALASAMASPGKPVHDVVAQVMADNETYELIICGHSLGAGVGTIIGLVSPWGLCIGNRWLTYFCVFVSDVGRPADVSDREGVGTS